MKALWIAVLVMLALLAATTGIDRALKREVRSLNARSAELDRESGRLDALGRRIDQLERSAKGKKP